ncbi:MAG: rRNA maturation RNase YbeY [Phycisphaerae bacterium]|jgi:probable rRNA maturation factor
MDDPTTEQHIDIQIARLCDKIKLPSKKIEQLINSICLRFGLSKAIISIAIVDDEHIIKLNEKYLRSKKVTDCLSFDLSDGQSPGEKCFEIVVNAELACRTAEQKDHSPRAELALYIAHGLLHQLGFDDQTGEQARQMHRTEQEILQSLGYDFLYD